MTGRKKILVTGGAGFIGTQLCGQLLQKGFEVLAADLLMFNDEGVKLHRSNALYEFIQGDLCNSQFLEIILKEVHTVVHLAAIVGDPACAKFPELAEQVNTMASEQLFVACKAAGVKHFIFSSTCSNYGVMKNGDDLLNESSDLNPVSLYAKQKVGFEKFLQRQSQGQTAFSILRFATAYGVSSRMRFDLTVNHFTRDLALGRELLVFGKDLWRPYCHNLDLAASVVAVIEAGPEKMNQKIYNVGDSSENYSKEKIVNEILQWVPAGKVNYSNQFSPDIRNYRVDFSKIRDELNFRVSLLVPDGIKEVLKLVTSGRISDPFDKIFVNA